MKAIIDRFEGDYAVVLFGDEEIKVDMQKLLPSERGRQLAESVI